MRISKMRVTCAGCNKASDVEIVVDGPIAVTAASMKSARCPHCGGSKLGLGGELDGKPPVSSPIAVRAVWWKSNGAVGMSSRTIYGAFTGDRAHEETVPLDPDDFSRCKKLFDLMPEWRADLQALRAKLPWWGPLIDNWDRMEEMFAAEDARGWKAPHKMCHFMEPLVRECEKLQGSGKAA